MFNLDPDVGAPSDIGPDPEPGRAIARQYLRSYDAFIRVYRERPIVERVVMADRYARYMNRKLGRAMRTEDVLAVWNASAFSTTPSI